MVISTAAVLGQQQALPKSLRNSGNTFIHM
jgi:hypothetical protein